MTEPSNRRPRAPGPWDSRHDEKTVVPVHELAAADPVSVVPLPSLGTSSVVVETGGRARVDGLSVVRRRCQGRVGVVPWWFPGNRVHGDRVNDTLPCRRTRPCVSAHVCASAHATPQEHSWRLHYSMTIGAGCSVLSSSFIVQSRWTTLQRGEALRGFQPTCHGRAFNRAMGR